MRFRTAKNFFLTGSCRLLLNPKPSLYQNSLYLLPRRNFALLLRFKHLWPKSSTTLLSKAFQLLAMIVKLEGASLNQGQLSNLAMKSLDVTVV